jgi:hypothetical protein
MGRYFEEGSNTSAREDILNNLRRNIQGVGGFGIQQKLKEQEDKKAIQQALQKMILEAALKNQQLKKGADLSKMDTSQGMGGILGQIPGMFERQPVQPTTSISISERPYAELSEARSIVGQTPESLRERGLTEEEINVVLDKTDPRVYGMEKLGWKKNSTNYSNSIKRELFRIS